MLYFRSFGPLVYNETDSIDATKSPIVNLVLPHVRRDILWTVGEVHFLSTLYMSQNRSIQNVARSFARWIKTRELVYDQSPKA